MPEYSPNLNIEKALGTENVNRAYFMRVIDDIDEKVGVVNGLAKLDANGNVLKANGTSATEVTKTEFDTHTGQAATTLKVGHVQLSDAVTSTEVTKAATSNAVRKAYNRAEEAFQSASDGKTAVASAVTAKGVAASSSDTFSTLATKIGQISTGKKYAKGEVGLSSSANELTISGLDFKPRLIFIGARGSEDNALNHTFWSSDLDATRAYLGGTNQPYTLSSLGHYVNTGGFKLKRGSAQYYPAFWIAYE